MLYLKNDDKIIESYYVLFKDKELSKKIKLSNYKNNANLKISSKVLEACTSGYVIQKQNIINLSFFERNNIETNIKEILDSNLSFGLKNYLLSEFDEFKDFMFFTELLKDKIVLEKYNEYQISELLKIKDLCQKNKIDSEANNILNITKSAEDNSKVLELTKRINKRKC